MEKNVYNICKHCGKVIEFLPLSTLCLQWIHTTGHYGCHRMPSHSTTCAEPMENKVVEMTPKTAPDPAQDVLDSVDADFTELELKLLAHLTEEVEKEIEAESTDCDNLET